MRTSFNESTFCKLDVFAALNLFHFNYSLTIEMDFNIYRRHLMLCAAAASLALYRVFHQRISEIRIKAR